MQNDRNLDMALQRALKSYLIGSALLSCVFYLAIPPSGYGVSLFWQFLSSIHQTTFLPDGTQELISRTWRERERWEG